MSQDPLGFAAGERNLYRYVANTPVDSVDPSGLQGSLITGSISSICACLQRKLDMLDKRWEELFAQWKAIDNQIKGLQTLQAIAVNQAGNIQVQINLLTIAWAQIGVQLNDLAKQIRALIDQYGKLCKLNIPPGWKAVR